jgi:hypothetical protein
MNDTSPTPLGFCPRCGYPIDPGTCPECGATVPERKVLRNHQRLRRRRIRKIALRAGPPLLLIGALAWAYHAVDWTKHMSAPTLLSLHGMAYEPATKELLRRDRAGLLNQTEFDAFIAAIGLEGELETRNAYPIDAPIAMRLKVDLPPEWNAARHYTEGINYAVVGWKTEVDGQVVSEIAGEMPQERLEPDRRTISWDRDEFRTKPFCPALPPGEPEITVHANVVYFHGGRTGIPRITPTTNQPFRCTARATVTVADKTREELLTLISDPSAARASSRCAAYIRPSRLWGGPIRLDLRFPDNLSDALLCMRVELRTAPDEPNIEVGRFRFDSPPRRDGVKGLVIPKKIRMKFDTTNCEFDRETAAVRLVPDLDAVFNTIDIDEIYGETIELYDVPVSRKSLRNTLASGSR